VGQNCVNWCYVGQNCVNWCYVGQNCVNWSNICVCVDTVNGVFIYRAQKGNWLSVSVRKDGTILSTQLSSPNLDTKH